MVRFAGGGLFALLFLTSTAIAVPKDCERRLRGTELDFSKPRIRNNNLFRASGLSLGALEYDKIRVEEFRPAFTRALRVARARARAISLNPAEPTFANTIEAIEAIDEPLDRTYNVFLHYLSVHANPALEKLAAKITPRLGRFFNDVYFDPAIFSRVEALYRKRGSLGLPTEQMTLLEKTYLKFVRNGAMLGKAVKARVHAIDKRLSLLAERYDQNLHQSRSAFELVVKDRARLDGLPSGAIQAAADEAVRQGRPGVWVFTLQPTSSGPFMSCAKDRSLRERVWRALDGAAASGVNDNRPVLLEIVQLRRERARLLGYDSHARYVTAESMAGAPENVTRFLESLAEIYKPAALNEVKELEAFAGHTIEPWDVAYYSERLRKARYGYDDEDLRPYFQLDQVIEGAFYVASRQYGLKFAARADLPRWHRDVSVYEVRDRDGSELALFYLDPFPRDSKRQGAWGFSVVSTGLFSGRARRPHIVNVSNVTPPLAGLPALLTLEEVRTVFHELGHGLHEMLSRTRYRSLSGLNVALDFVEMPSQLYENWAVEPEVLAVYARHYKTGEPMPKELVSKMRSAVGFQSGLIGLRDVSEAMLDMAWHMATVEELKSVEDVVAFEKNVMASFQALKTSSGFVSTNFAHIFAEDYSAGFYGYLWSRRLAERAVSIFRKAGIFDPETSARFRREILEKGGSESPALLYQRFTGGDSGP